MRGNELQVSNAKTYWMEAGYSGWLWFGLVFFPLLAALNFYLFLSGDVHLGAATGVTAFCAFMVIVSIAQLRRANAIAVDEDGIWVPGQSKHAALVRWSQIANLREHWFGRSLGLIGSHGKTLISLAYDLRGFDELQHLVVSKLAPPFVKPGVGYGRALSSRMVIWLSVATVATAIFFLIRRSERDDVLLAIAVGFVFAMILVGVCQRVSGITLHQHFIAITYPFRNVAIRMQDITSVELVTVVVYSKGKWPNYFPTVLIQSSAETHRITGLSIAAGDLYRSIEELRRAYARAEPQVAPEGLTAGMVLG